MRNGIITGVLLTTVSAVILLPASARSAVETDRNSTATLAATSDSAIGSASSFVARTSRDSIGRIVAPVIINGQGPFRFVVDTGATHSVMSSALARQLNLTVRSYNNVLLRGVTGSASVTSVQVEQLQTGDLVLKNRLFPIVDELLQGADGVLGMQGLEDKRIVVDFRRGRIQILESRGSYMRAGYVTVPIQLAFDRLMLADAYIGGLRVKAIIDTGAQRTLGNTALRDALGITNGYFYAATATSVQGVTAQIQNADYAITPRIRLGSLQLNQVGVIFGDMHVFDVWGFREQPALVLGMDVIGVLDSLVIDYGRKEIQIRPRNSAPRTGSRLMTR